ncbi:MAG: hypothetical protein PHS07_00285 [Patescibacteria group bacterium]|nr:hypothetical protein [Patescibacteria group bacterium]
MLKQVQYDTLGMCHCEEESADSADDDACPPQAGGNPVNQRFNYILNFKAFYKNNYIKKSAIYGFYF